MKLLNLGCGYPRIAGDEWVNLDNLKAQLPEGSPERAQLESETNYVDHDIASGPLPFEGDTFDGVLASHVLEHFDAPQGLALMIECRRVLKIGGVLVVSVPDASYFRKVHCNDEVRNWPQLFAVTDYENPIPTFFEAALWFEQHKAILTEDALWGYFMRAGFQNPARVENDEKPLAASVAMMAHLNRRKFSLEMIGFKG